MYFFTGNVGVPDVVSCKKSFKAKVLPLDFLPFFPAKQKENNNYINYKSQTTNNYTENINKSSVMIARVHAVASCVSRGADMPKLYVKLLK